MSAPLRPFIQLKEGVSLVGLRPEMSFGASIAASVFLGYGYDAIITSVTEGQHSLTSLHYVGFAVDFRVRHIPEDLREAIANTIRSALGAEFDVILKPTHIHVEFQPKR